MPLIEVLAQMERVGLRLDAERLARIGAGMAEQIDSLEAEIYEHAGHEFTIGSPQQLGTVLFDELELTKKRRGKTGLLDRRPGAGADPRRAPDRRQGRALARADQAQEHLPRLRCPELVDPETGRIHTTFNQVSTTTGRLSSTNPNLQNIPIRSEVGRPVRGRASSPAEGRRLLSCDYNQVELRVLAHVAREDVLREIFASGEDVHAETAAEDHRRSSPRRSARPSARRRRWSTTGSPTGSRPSGWPTGCNIERDEAAVYIERYFERFPAVKAFIDETIAGAEKRGYVTTLMGRRRNIPELRSGNPQRRGCSASGSRSTP